MFDGTLGWIAAADESVAYGTLGTSLVYQQGISAGIKLREVEMVPPTLGSNSAHAGIRLLTWGEGPVVLAHTDEDDDIGLIYDHVASASGNVYTFGGTPTVDSLSFCGDIDEVEYDALGCFIRSLQWDLKNNDFSTLTLDVLARSVSKYTGAARTPTLPPATEIVTPGNLATFTIGGTQVGSLTGAQVKWAWPCTDIARARLGATVMPKPRRVGRPTITGTFNLELNDDTGDDTVAIIDDLLANTELGTIAFDNFSLAGCRAMGDLPDVAAGLRNFSLSVRATGLTVTTT